MTGNSRKHEDIALKILQKITGSSRASKDHRAKARRAERSRKRPLQGWFSLYDDNR